MTLSDRHFVAVESSFVDTASVRRAVVDEGDIRGDIEFQNDINGIIARLNEKVPPIEALGWVREPAVAPTTSVSRPELSPDLHLARLLSRVAAARPFQVIPGGAGWMKTAEPIRQPQPVQRQSGATAARGA